MARKTFYDVLEVSTTASPEVLHAAFERLSARFSPKNSARPKNATDARIRMKYEAIQEAFTALSDPHKRALYDLQLRPPQATAAMPVQAAVAPMRGVTWPTIIMAGVMMLALLMLYLQHRESDARVRNETAMAQAQAREATERAAIVQAEWRASQAVARYDQERRTEDIRVQGQVQLAMLQYQTDAQRDQQRERLQAEAMERQRVAQEQAVQRDQQRRLDAETRRKQEELQAASAARQQLARDRNELCILERQRYGRALSC